MLKFILQREMNMDKPLAKHGRWKLSHKNNYKDKHRKLSMCLVGEETTQIFGIKTKHKITSIMIVTLKC